MTFCLPSRVPAFLLALAAPFLAAAAGMPLRGQAPEMPTDVRARMEAFNRALGVACTHCHAEGDWKDAAKPAFATAVNMAKMVAAVNERIGQPDRVRCWTCHRGETRPPRQPRTTGTMNGLFQIFPTFMPPTGRTQCFMCHQGSTSPARN